MTTDTEQRLRDLAPFYFHRLASIEVEGDGWTGLLEEVIAEAKLRSLDGFSFAQIKEKMGELRIYVNMADDVAYEDFRSFHNYLNTIETRSGTVCEVCGQSGRRRQRVWVRTLCDAHV